MPINEMPQRLDTMSGIAAEGSRVRLLLCCSALVGGSGMQYSWSRPFR